MAQTHPLFPRELDVIYTYQALHDQIEHLCAMLGRELLRAPEAQEFKGSSEVLCVCDFVGVAMCESLEFAPHQHNGLSKEWFVLFLPPATYLIYSQQYRGSQDSVRLGRILDLKGLPQPPDASAIVQMRCS